MEWGGQMVLFTWDVGVKDIITILRKGCVLRKVNFLFGMTKTSKELCF